MTITETRNTFLKVEDLKKTFQKRGLFNTGSGIVRAVDNVNFQLQKGDILGLIGESGCGKTTLGRLLLGLMPVTSGEIILDNINVSNAKRKDIKQLRKRSRMIFQSLDAALNPYMNIRQIIEEPLKLYTQLSKEERGKKIEEVLERVNLSQNLLSGFPSSLSGGQKRRVSIARAIIVPPNFIVADEPVSALDMSIRAQIISLFNELQKELGITMIFISHDISILSEICNKIAVMYSGSFIEFESTDRFFTKKHTHSFTKKLMSSIIELNI